MLSSTDAQPAMQVWLVPVAIIGPRAVAVHKHVCCVPSNQSQSSWDTETGQTPPHVAPPACDAGAVGCCDQGGSKEVYTSGAPLSTKACNRPDVQKTAHAHHGTGDLGTNWLMVIDESQKLLLCQVSPM